MTKKSYKIHVIAMIRNEADILPGFITRSAALFDMIHVAEHQSTDGSRQILEHLRADFPSLHLYDYRFRAFYQDEVSNCMARQALECGADWVFLLDADEFLDVEDRAGLEALIEGLPSDVMLMRWMNLIPGSRGEFHRFDADQQFRWNGVFSRYSKIGFSKDYAAKNPRFYVHAGNHAVSPTRREPPSPAEEGCPVLHVPIRSLDRFRYKLESGVRGFKAKAVHSRAEGFHKFELLNHINSGAIADDWIDQVIAYYGERLENIPHLAQQTEARWTTRTIPGPETPDLTTLSRSLDDTIEADSRVNWIALTTGPDIPLGAKIHAGEILLEPRGNQGRLLKEDGAVDIESTVAAPDVAGDPIYPRIHRPASFNPLAYPICTRTPRHDLHDSSWRGHIPFAMGLMDMVRPRSLVELGTYRGASYRAFCQAIKELRLDTRCFAVDTWHGDPHTGFYGPQVLEDLRRHHDAEYALFSELIQETFDHALARFVDDTIDVINIDGFHTYNAVRHDFESWLPKMSRRGVMLLHGIEIRDREDFGVWRFWDEIKQEYPFFEFYHSSGLGVLAVGTTLADGLRPIVEAPQAEADRIREFFRNLGEHLTEFSSISLQKKKLQELLLSSHDQAIAQSAALSSTQAELASKSVQVEQLTARYGKFRYRVIEGLANRIKRYPRICGVIRAGGRGALAVKQNIGKRGSRVA